MFRGLSTVGIVGVSFFFLAACDDRFLWFAMLRSQNRGFVFSWYYISSLLCGTAVAGAYARLFVCARVHVNLIVLVSEPVRFDIWFQALG